MLLLLSFLFFHHHHLFDDRLEQRDLRNYKTDLHQIFRDGRHVGVDFHSGVDFRTGQGTLPWESSLDAKSAEIGDRPTFLGLAFHNRWQCGKADGRVNSAGVLSTSYENLVSLNRSVRWCFFGEHLCAKWVKSAKCV